MSNPRLRSRWSFGRGNRSAATLLGAAGRAADSTFELLESRVLLSDPGSTFETAQELVLDGNGQATYDDALPDTSDVDMYTFSLASPDFTTVLADALNAGDAYSDRVDTRVDVYDYKGNLVGSGTDSGSLSGGTPKDAWYGFVPTSAQKNSGTGLYTYYVKVTAQTAPTNGATGAYTIRVDGQTTEIVHSGTATEKNTSGTLTLPLQDIVYHVTTTSSKVWNSLATANVRADSNVLDSRIDIYDSTGALITGDSQSGRLTNAFTIFKSAPSKTFYFRVRSDEFAPGRPRTGAYTLALDMVGKTIDLDPVSRQGLASGDVGGKDRTELYQFIPQSSGDAILSAQGTPLIPLSDPAMTLYDTNGDFVAFSDRFFGDSPQIEGALVGGETYYVLIDGFDFPTSGTFAIFIEASHNFVEGLIDDHANTLDFEHATPIVWSDWQQSEDNVLGQGPLVDHSLVSLGTATGRIHRGSDTDMFVFVPPVDMLGSYTGNVGAEVDEDMDGQSDRDGDAVQDGAAIPWYETYRPSTRVEIQIQAFEDPGAPSFTWLTPAVRVFDSLGNVVYDLNLDTFNDVLVPPLDFAGSLDPARYYADLDFGTLGVDYAGAATPFDGVFSLEVWGGEPYYIEVSGVSGSGRYNAFVSLDGFPDPTDQSNWSTIASDTPLADDSFTGIADDTGTHIVSGFIETTNNFSNSPSDFAAARTMDLGVANGGWSGPASVADNYLDGSASLERGFVMGDADYPTPWTFPLSIADGAGATLLAGYDSSGQVLGDFDNTGVTVLRESGLAGIEHPLDNDLYTFRAASSGYAEVRINTTQLSDWFSEWIADGEGPLVDSTADDVGFYLDDNMMVAGDYVQPQNYFKEKVYNSILDSALRVFSNDFEQIGYNNDNNAMKGETETTHAGVNGDYTFHRRDARVVFPIVKGEVYYVQVESGQRDQFLAWQDDPTLSVAWQHMIGSYEMLLHTVPTLTNDDFVDFPGADATMIGIDETTGSGSISGQIDNNISNPFDSDTFVFVAPASSDFTVTAARQSGESLIPDVTVYREDTLNNFAIVATGTASSQGSITLDLSATKGDRFYIQVIGAGSTEGLYDIAVDGLAVVDDHADWLQFQGATEIELLDFLGAAEATGSIEGNGDTDVFRFEAGDFTDATITVSATDGAFDPFVDVYEVSLDPSGNPILLRMIYNDNLSAETSDAQVTLGLTPERLSGATGLAYPFYYVVVRGANLNSDEGDYKIHFDIDKTDDHPDAGQFSYADPVALDNESGQGSDTGTIEVVGDTDLFRFTALAGGTARVTVSRPTGSTFLPKISILDADGNELDSSDGLVPGTAETTVTRGKVYYVLIEASTIADPDETTGDYTLALVIPPLDDYPNAGEWTIAAPLSLDPTTGDAVLGTQSEGNPLNPAINVVGDTDLFTFSTIAAGNITITFAPLETSAIGMRPTLTIFDADFNTVQTVTASTAGETISAVLTGTVKNVRYYVLVGDALGNRTGEYQLTVDGNGSGGGGGGGGNGEIDFGNATEIELDPFNADGSANGVISQAGERDLFMFTAPASGDVFVTLSTPRGALLDGTITILDAATETAVLTFDATGIPGANAAVRFSATGPGAQYWVIVDGVGTGVGSYTLRVDAEPAVYRVFYPAGFTGSTIREFVSLANPNAFALTYSVILHYETGERDQTIVSNATLDAGSRGGVTISNALAGSPVGARIAPYAIEVRALEGPIAASIGHYDFGATTGDAFTNTISPIWSLARLERDPGAVNDFLLYFNPHDFDVNVTLTVYDTFGAPIEVSTVVGALRRGGLNLDQVAGLPLGVFGGIVTAAPVASTDADAFQGIVVGQSHFDLVDESGFGQIGDALGGGLAGAIPNLTQSESSTTEVALFNPNPFTTTVTLDGQYVRADLPDLVKVITLAPRETRVLSGTDLGMIDGQPLGLRYSANLPITMSGNQQQYGDSDGALGASQVGTGWFFGAAFINTALAGESYFETLGIYNPSPTTNEISVELLFLDGTSETLKVLVSANSFAEVRLHETLGSDFEANSNRPAKFDASAILGRPGLNYFSVVVSAPSPMAVSFTHYDLFLQGGWTNSGAVFGPMIPISAIV